MAGGQGNGKPVERPAVFPFYLQFWRRRTKWLPLLVFFFNFYFTACDLVLISFHPKIFFSFSLCFCAAPLHIACSSFPKRISGKTGFSPDLFLSRFSSKSIIRYLMRYFYCGAFLFFFAEERSGTGETEPKRK